MLTLLVFALDLSSASSVTRGIIYLILVLTALWSPWRYDAFLVAGSCTAGILLAIALGPSSDELSKMIDERTLAICSLWATALLVYERKAGARTIRKFEGKFRTLFERTGDALQIVNQKGQIIACNQNACKLFGYSQEEMVEKTVQDLVPSELVGSLREYQARILRNGHGRTVNFESLALKKGGTTVSVEISSTPIESEGFKHFIYFIRDIVRRKALEKRLRQVQKLEALGQLASGVAHDFNNTLSVILGRVDLMNTPEIPQKIRRHLEIMSKAALGGAKTVKRLQEFARNRETRLEEIVHLHTVISDVVEMTRPRWKHEAEKDSRFIRVITEARASVDAIRGDESELHEALFNLMNNALDAMPEGGRITLSTENRPGEVTLSVLDSGIGMDPETLQRATEPFFTTKTGKGTGLGLSMVHSIVERHGGKFDLRSTPGKGTAVQLTFPILTDGDLSSEGPQDREKPERKRISSGESVRFLVIDDKSEIVEMLVTILTEAGYEVEGTIDPQEGLRKFKTGGFDIVFTDLGMPGMSGWEVVREIRKGKPEVPIVLITGWAAELEQKILDRSGIDLVIPKPFTRLEILSSVEEILAPRKNRGREERLS
jgi:PAS domain S-box-containing protein